jgi:hypothetical protein
LGFTALGVTGEIAIGTVSISYASILSTASLTAGSKALSYFPAQNCGRRT